MTPLRRLGCAVLLGACASDSPSPPAATDAMADPGPIDEALPIVLAHDCERLEELSGAEPLDASVLWRLCPDVELRPTLQRSALLQAGSAAAVTELLPRLAASPDLHAMARLVSGTASGLDTPETLPAHAEASVSPVDDDVLSHVELAHALLVRPDVDHDERTRARAYLTKVHVQAMQQLGLGGTEALPPFGRLLAARSLHHGRELCNAYWYDRVLGLESVFAETEVDLLRLVLALERTPHTGDSALLAVERQRARRYVQRPGPRARIAARLGRVPDASDKPDLQDLAPLSAELDRLLDHQFIDLALSRGLHVAGQSDGTGVIPMADRLRTGLIDRGLRAFEPLLERRLRQARARTPRPREQGGPPLVEVADLGWATADEIADVAVSWLIEASATAEFPRRHALARVVLQLRRRPDAIAPALEQALLRSETREHIPLLVTLAREHDHAEVSGLRRDVVVATEELEADAELATRRRHAWMAHDAGKLPR